MLVINLFAGPGAGKSTIAAQLFALMKWKGYSVELVTEFAKQKTWEESWSLLADQVYVTAKQNRSLDRLKGKVNYVITDSPLLLGCYYAADDQIARQLCIDLFSTYNNINFMLQRTKPYVMVGRTQSETEAKNIDLYLKGLMTDLNYEYNDIIADKFAADSILDVIENL